MINAFLTRDDRNTFIGTLALARMYVYSDQTTKMLEYCKLGVLSHVLGGDQISTILAHCLFGTCVFCCFISHTTPTYTHEHAFRSIFQPPINQLGTPKS
jgi:hypothetical protein